MSNHPTAVKRHSIVKRIVFSLLATLLVLAILFFVYVGNYYPASEEALQILHSTSIVVTETPDAIFLSPISAAPATGYVFYPGGKVDEKAYLPYLAGIAEGGYFCALIKSPFRLAILGINDAQPIISGHPEINQWAVGGHSLGGVAAASFASSNPSVSGLVFLASYPTKDLSSLPLQVLSITATEDKVLNWDQFHANQAFLPPSTIFVEISGGNHGQFGSYGSQKGDGTPLITEQEQRQQAVAATLQFLETLE